MEKIKVGIFGAGRGLDLANCFEANGMEVVGICDKSEPHLNHALRRYGSKVKAVKEYSELLDMDLDAVLLANYALEHTSPAIQALEAGKHVLSECMSCFTMAEGVALAEAVEKSGRIYMIAENYPFFAYNLEMKRLFETAKYGDFVYGECEYIHPGPPGVTLISGPDHWRCWMPATYYCTHSMGPVMNITGTYPVSVNGFVFPHNYAANVKRLRQNDEGAILMCKMNNDAVVKIMPFTTLRDHGTRTRICCEKGTMEYNQGDPRLRIHTEAFDFPEDRIHNQWYKPTFPPELKGAAVHGHDGGDYCTAYYFKKAIETGVIEPKLDIYSALQMTMIGIQGYRSALENSNTMEIPDMRDPVMREKYRHDDWNPDPARYREGMPYPSIRGKITPTEEAFEFFETERPKYLERLKNGK